MRGDRIKRTPQTSGDGATMARQIAMALGISAAFAAALHGATVQTKNGQTLTGTIDVASSGLVVTPAGSAPATVPLADVAALSMAQPLPQSAETVSDPKLPAGWMQTDIGEVRFPGSGSFADDVFTLSGSGWGIWGVRDSAHAVLRPWSGDGILTAHLATPPTDNNPFVAGVTLRQSAAADAAEASVMLHPGSTPHLQSRPGGPGKIAAASGSGKAFTWVRLVRSGDDVTGLCSIDGQMWTTIGSAKLHLTDPLVAGIAISAQGNEAAYTTTFDHVTLQPGARFPAEGIGLVDGSVILGIVTAWDDKTIHYTIHGNDTDLTLPLDHVAYIFTRPIVTPIEQVDPSNKPSAVLASGDVIEGTVGKLYAGRLHMDSLVFGPQDEDYTQVVFVMLHPVNATAPISITTTAGGVYRGTQMTAGNHAITIATDALGAVSVPLTDIWSIATTSVPGK
jgi:hypothetical protein